jgi:hypothetical protein
MQLKGLSAAGLTFSLASTLYAASPFVGKWKIDEAKSRLAGVSDSVTAAGPNA